MGAAVKIDGVGLRRGDKALRHVRFITNMYILHHLSSFANKNVIGARIINLSGAGLPEVFTSTIRLKEIR